MAADASTRSTREAPEAARRSDLLATALADPASVATPGFEQWEELIRRAREGNLLGALADRIEVRSRVDRVPGAPRAHLIGASVRAKAQAMAVRRELGHLARALAEVDAPVVLLKGAAYLCAALPAARGRMFSDIDILVPKERLSDVESALLQAGFATTHTHPYDQRYYRQWMHELPPMQHVRRQTVLDVHHALVPETSRMHPDSGLLLNDARPLGNSTWLPYPASGDDPGDSASGTPASRSAARFSILAPVDMTLHCATHLFCDEDFSHATRDLVDFDSLVRHFATTEPGFWNHLVSRARTLELSRPLWYALLWSGRVHRTPVPTEVLRDAHAGAPPIPVRQLMNGLLGPALRPTQARASTRWARRALYVRGHWLKMPPRLLAWHLTVKAFRRQEKPPDDADAGQ